MFPKAIDFLKELGIEFEHKQFPESTEKGAANVAKALGHTERQMVKTLIFQSKDGEFVCILVGGDQNAVSKHLKKVVGSKDVRMASPDDIKELTGYVVGSIPPFSWQKENFRTFIDESLKKEEVLGVGAGRWGEEIMISFNDLVKASNSQIVNLTDKEKPIFPEVIHVDDLKLSGEHLMSEEVDLLPENEKVSISEINKFVGKEITIQGWMYNKRSSGKINFLQLRDGSGFIQATVEKSEVAKDVWDNSEKLTIESSCQVKGLVKEEPRSPSGFELDVRNIDIIQIAPEYPIGKKEHGPEFLFKQRDLYLRSKTPWAVLRIRNQMFLSITKFFEEEGFIRYDTPILQPTSCEDTTQLFEVDYYGDKMYLSQSGQLYSEAGIMAFGKVYDFGPVFRAEKSKTRHHLSELWMMDAEMAFYNQEMNMDLQERLVKRIVGDVLEFRKTELEILERDTTILEKVAKEPFIRMKHFDVKKLIEDNGMEVDYMDDMTTEEEIWLGHHFKNCVFIEDYPFAVKSFYMKKYTSMKTYKGKEGIENAVNSDLVAPEEGREIIGGSQRETDYNLLVEEIIERGYPLDDYEWYLDIRKYGTVPHSGFGIGLERTLRWITGVHHIRETIPFPRSLVIRKP